eukprot:TRINITY_DN15480_c0_g1::TRINITY_DN15480_c0_g1_i1::g.30568::m.30568 TRINITY_DN15480_c0_g1::TRINITY_DN15480_c0_g1_i1::g.30568  ORF type:complete len:282 (+),score=-7.65,sp/Q1ZXG8/D1060_DICDI/47.50/8e-45,Y_phosphatase2/PF03162.8/1.8e-42 TRINITY_DN15480_c0_g1_i1:138-983(+)
MLDEELGPVCPPQAFGIVETNVFRSNPPYPVNFSFLRRLRLKTALYLTPDEPMQVVSQFFDECGTKLLKLGQKSWKPSGSWKPLSDDLVKDALELILNAEMHPLVIMCNTGLHFTGTVVGCLRRIQHWNMTSILNEYRIYASTKVWHVHEQFIELFDVDLVTLPKVLPEWYLWQCALLEEEEQEFRYLDQQGRFGPKYEIITIPRDAKTSTSISHVNGSTSSSSNLINNGEMDSRVTVLPEASAPPRPDLIPIPTYRKFFFSSNAPLISDDAKRKLPSKKL